MVLCEELKIKIPSKEAKFCYGAPYIDRFYNTTPAGTRKECSKLTVKHCLEHLIRPPSPEVVKKLNSWCNPGVEERRTFHALINDPQLKEARDMRHGLVSKDRTDIKELIRPKEPTAIEDLTINTKEEIYDSVKRKPLGSCPRPNIPPNIDPVNTTFGVPSVYNEGVGPLVNPPKRRVDILREEQADRIHYLISHKRLLPGEQGHRRYVGFDPTKTFGLKYRSDPRGTFVRRALNWVSEDQAKFQSPVMSQRQFDFNERYQNKLGKARDPIADTMNLPEDHAFGLPLASGEPTVGQLLHGRVPREIIGLPFENITGKSTATKDQLCLDTGEQRTMLLSVVHHALRRAAFGRGPEMTAVMCQRAKGANLLPMTEARTLFSFFDVPLDEELTELVFDTVSVEAPPDMVEAVRKTQQEKVPKNVLIEKTLGNSDQTEWAVDWRLLAAFLDCNRQIGGAEWTKLKDCGCAWTKSQKAERFEPVDAVRRRLRKAIDANMLTFTTSNGQYQGESEGLVPSDCWLRLGKPPVLRNRPVPKNRGCLDKKDYGDEAGIRSVLQPNVFTEYGLTQRDLLMLRGKDEIRRIIEGCGLSGYFNPNIAFDDVWNKAAEVDKDLLQELASKDGERVSLYSFREVLFGKRAEEIRRTVNREYTEMCC